MSNRQINRALFLDTEFTGLDDPYPFLISIGLVDEDGRNTFYAEVERSNWERKAELWVWQHVVPHLESGAVVMPISEMGRRLRAWIRDLDQSGSPLQIVCDSPDYDWKFVAPLLHPDWPDGLALTPIRFDSRALGPDRELWLRSVIESCRSPNRPAHHALHDALALRAGWLAARAEGWTPAIRDPLSP